MIKKFSICMLGLLGLMACSDKVKKEETGNNKPVIEEKIIGPKEDYLVFENSLTKKDIDSASYINVELTNNGAKFSDKESSYIKIPNINLDLKEDFNISFWFKFYGMEGKIPKALLAYRGSSPSSNSPIFIYLPARKLSGSFGSQILWAENYNMKEGNSKLYYDSVQLMPDTPYFVSINYLENKMQFYVESELYAEYENVSTHDMIGKDLYLGGLLLNDELKYPLDGSMKSLKIFSRSLTEKEIVKLYNVELAFE
ncbi:MAG: hypothetical protein QM478_01965 [Flavobacteriaceae bacterium]